MVAYYKSIQFDACCPLRIAYQGQPATDSGGVLRQFYSDLFEGLVDGKLMLLFEGENASKVPSYQPQVVMSGMFEMVGKMIAHSLVQGGPGFPCLALPCYYYLSLEMSCLPLHAAIVEMFQILSQGILSFQVCSNRSLSELWLKYIFMVNHFFLTVLSILNYKLSIILVHSRIPYSTSTLAILNNK